MRRNRKRRQGNPLGAFLVVLALFFLSLYIFNRVKVPNRSFRALEKLTIPIETTPLPSGSWNSPGSEETVTESEAEEERDDFNKLTSTRHKGSRIAIVIDDLGQNLAAAQPFLELKAPVTLSILPKLSYSKTLAERAQRAGLEVLVHLPMEPENSEKNPGPGAITTTMTEEEIKKAVEGALKTVPGAVGISNHMGSKATADERVMRAVLAVAKAHNLFFLDNLTTNRSVVSEVAVEIEVPVVVRREFLDNEDSVDYVKERLGRLSVYAKGHGEAIGVGHPRENTAKALKEMLPQLETDGIEIVPLSKLLP